MCRCLRAQSRLIEKLDPHGLRGASAVVDEAERYFDFTDSAGAQRASSLT
jgi:hypothetical protein